MQIDKTIQSTEALAHLFENRKIFLDASSLLVPSAGPFLYQVTAVLRNLGQKMYMPLELCLDLRYSVDYWPEKETLQERAALSLIQLMEDDKLLDVRSSFEETSGKHPLCRVFAAHRFHHRLLLITQNEDLARGVLALNQDSTYNPHSVEVYSINANGALQRYAEAVDPYAVYEKEVQNLASVDGSNETKSDDEGVDTKSDIDFQDYVSSSLNRKTRRRRTLFSWMS